MSPKTIDLSASNESERRSYQSQELEIVKQLLETRETTRSLAVKYECSSATIKVIFRRHTTKEQRLKAKAFKQGKSLKENGNRKDNNIAEIARFKKPFKGKKHTPEARRKQSESHTGKTMTPQQSVAMSARQQGVTIDEWKGYTTPDDIRQRKGTLMSLWRAAVLDRDNYTCRMCGKRGGNLHTHHIKPFAKFPELRLDVTNGVTLCDKPCHKQTISKEHLYEHLFVNS